MNAQSFFVPVFSGSLNTRPELLCNARDLHKVLQVGRKFATWIVERIKEYGFIENQDFTIISQNGEKIGRGRPTTDYHLTLDMAKELAMVEKTEVGRQVRRYFIQCEQERYGNLNRQAQIAHTISAEEAERISQKVLERCGRTGESWQKVYRGLHEYLGVDSYHHIPASMFATAMRYLDSLPQAPELFRQPEAPKGIAITEEQLYQLSTLTRYARQMSELYHHLYPALNRLGSAYTGEAGSWAEVPHYWIGKMQDFLHQAYPQMHNPKHIEGVKANFAMMA
ncbi:MAG: antA/AntB antirepressor family protein [Eikenella sp.]|nr:antA/AntB antirepressor family protein [Eikenella sp.]